MSVRVGIGPSLLVVVLLAFGVMAAPAGAAFDAPVELAKGDFGTSVAAATDARGATTAAVVAAGGAQLVTRAGSRAAWAAAVPLPGRELGRVAGPVVAAAGAGAAAVAWRIDTPRRYGAIAALVRDPGAGGAGFGEPVVVSPDDANGVRHPALAVDGEGRVLLAYNTNTRATHLSMRGGIAVALRGRGGAFEAPVVVDPEPGGAPAVAVGPDGRGVVAWLRARRIWAVSVDVERGTVGRVRALTPVGSFRDVEVAAGPEGAATVAFVRRRPDRRGVSSGYDVAALRRRGGGGTFPRAAQVVASVGRRGFLRELAIAADEEGRTTVAWSAEDFGSDRGVGVNGITSGVDAAVAVLGAARFGGVRHLVPRGRLLCDPPSVAAADGQAVVGAVCHDRTRVVVQAVRLRGSRATTPMTVVETKPNPAFGASATPVNVGIDAGGTMTVIVTQPDPPITSQPAAVAVKRVLAATGR